MVSAEQKQKDTPFKQITSHPNPDQKPFRAEGFWYARAFFDNISNASYGSFVFGRSFTLSVLPS